MKEKGNMKALNKVKSQSEEILDSERVIGPGGLYTPQPVPAQIVLSYAKQYSAQRLLLTLSSYLGTKSSRCVYPTYEQIQARTKMSSSTVSKSINVLLSFGFIKVWKWRENGKSRTKYYFQDSCWHTYKMNNVSRFYLPDLGVCSCGEIVKEGDFTFGQSDYHHFKCGGVIQLHPDSTRYIDKRTKLRAKTLREARNPDSLPEEK